MIDLSQKDTIIAQITPPGTGAVSGIRISGPRTVQIAHQVFPKKQGSFLSHQACVLSFVNPKSGALVDECLVIFFQEGKSYTGNSSLEIFCHGNPILVHTIIEVCESLGARLAEPGEFTFRAFLNGKVDLLQAEAVHSIVKSQTQMGLNRSLDILGGHFSSQLKVMEKTLIRSLAHLEASIDFSEENLEVQSYSVIDQDVKNIRDNLKMYISRSEVSQAALQGVRVVLLGEPNVGKSSLFNKLIGSDRVLVSDTAGTTRDVVESSTYWNGVKYTFFDTAGLRDTEDRLESLGIAQSRKWLEQADLVFLVISWPKMEIPPEVFDWPKGRRIVLIVNKSDLAPESDLEKITILGKDQLSLVGMIHTNQESCRDKIYAFLSTWSQSFMSGLDELSLSLANRELFQGGVKALDQALELMARSASPEFVALELREALLKVQKILGIVYEDQIVDEIFKQFCLGK